MSKRQWYRRARRSRPAVVGVLGVLLTLGAIDQAALAEPSPEDAVPKPDSGGGPVPITDPVPAGFESWDDVWAVQEDLNETADRITLVAATQDVAGGGLGSIVADTEEREVRVYWKGQVPGAVQRVVDDSDADVAVVRAAYTAEELQAEAERILAEQPVSEGAVAPLVRSVGPRSDASGLTVGVTGSATAAKELAFIRDAEVDIAVDGGVAPAPGTRRNDSPAYWGGALWTLSGQIDGCSSAFAISRGAQEAMLSAAHCASNGDYIYDGGGLIADMMGKVQGSQLPGKPIKLCSSTGNCYVTGWLGMDVLEIKASVAPRIYAGGVGSGETSHSVVGAQNSYPGNLVCTSGSYSGSRCKIEVEDIGWTMFVKFHTDGRPMYGSHMVHAVHQAGESAGGNGDSGGPVVAYASSSQTRAWAHGVMALFDYYENPATCTGIPASSVRLCTSEIWYTGLNWSLSAGAQLQTTWP